MRPSEDEQAALAQAYANAGPAALAALLNPSLTGDEANADDWRMAEIPAANGHGTALGLVTVFGTLVDGSERLISAKTLQTARTGNGRHTDLVLGFPLEFGLGVRRCPAPRGISVPTRPRSAMTASAGRRSAPIPRPGVAFAYVMNRMGMNLVDDPRKMAMSTPSTAAWARASRTRPGRR